MDEFEIKPAQRVAQKALVALWGGSFSGKSASALRLARGIVGPSGRILMIDTEHERGLNLSGFHGVEFDHLNLEPPFTPDRLVKAYRQGQHRGYDLIIIDSISKIWDDEGGVIDSAMNAKTKSGAEMEGLARWLKPKTEFKRMTQYLLRSNTHTIYTLRARMKREQVGKTVEKIGLEPVIGDDFIYEMTFSMAMANHRPLFPQIQNNRLFVRPDIPSIKAPDEVMRLIRPNEYLTEEVGVAMRLWLDGGERDIVKEARRTAHGGTENLKAWWDSLSRDERAALKPMMDEFKAIAQKADAAMAQAQGAESSPLDDPIQADPFNDGFGGKADEPAPPPPPVQQPPPAVPKMATGTRSGGTGTTKAPAQPKAEALPKAPPPPPPNNSEEELFF